MPGQCGLSRKGTLHAVRKLDLFVALDLANARLAEVIGLLDGLGRSEQADHQANEDETSFFHIMCD